MKRILIVEDEPEIRQLLASYLVNEGYFVSEAEDGVTAIELFSKENGIFRHMTQLQNASAGWSI